MYITAQVIGILAVAALLFSYQLKRRKQIIFVNAISSMLYVLQYVLLGALEGAVIDVLTAVSTVVAHRKDTNFIRKHTKVVVWVLELSIVAAGLVFYRNIFSLCSIAGAVCQTSAFWITEEKKLRLVSFLGTPFWLVYNLANSAYGAAFGSVLSVISVGLAIYRYDIRPKKQEKQQSVKR